MRVNTPQVYSDRPRGGEHETRPLLRQAVYTYIVALPISGSSTPQIQKSICFVLWKSLVLVTGHSSGGFAFILSSEFPRLSPTEE